MNNEAVKQYTILLLLFTLTLTACAPAGPEAATAEASNPGPRTLNVFAAASLTDAFTEMGKNFEAANPGVTVTFNFAGSQALKTQIEEGAPADVFASANQTEMEALVSGGYIAQGASKNFLSNKLVLILPADNPALLETLEDLARPGIKLVLAAEEVPVGKYARQVLDNLNRVYGSDFKEKTLANVVSNEDNVKQVVAKVQLGEADAGIVYTSDAVAAPDLKTIEIPGDTNVIAKYPIATLTQSANTDVANAFITYILSSEGQTILRKWGFAPTQ